MDVKQRDEARIAPHPVPTHTVHSPDPPRRKTDADGCSKQVISLGARLAHGHGSFPSDLSAYIIGSQRHCENVGASRTMPSVMSASAHRRRRCRAHAAQAAVVVMQLGAQRRHCRRAAGASGVVVVVVCRYSSIGCAASSSSCPLVLCAQCCDLSCCPRFAAGCLRVCEINETGKTTRRGQPRFQQEERYSNAGAIIGVEYADPQNELVDHDGDANARAHQRRESASRQCRWSWEQCGYAEWLGRLASSSCTDHRERIWIWMPSARRTLKRLQWPGRPATTMLHV